ncbi:MAG: glycosyltransferase family A protein [Paracoccaceae bacterium]|nr:glycosyltransferase family A protein [Paracoccaceae bacterium]
MNENRAPSPRLIGVTGTRAQSPWDVAVIVPARNESRRIQTCLLALADAIDCVPETVGVIVCVNDTQDDTASRSIAILQMRGISHLVLDMEFPGGTGGVARVRDMGCKLSQRIAGQPAVVMTTDADSRVAPDWVKANLEALEAADLVFGTVIPDPEELSQLAPHLARLGTGERDYMQAAVRLVAMLDPVPHDPEPAHLSPAGASVALWVSALNQLGSIAWDGVSEGRALAARAEEMDLRIRHAAGPRVVTSCRLKGRTKGGMACTLRDRCAEVDPWCDAFLEPALAMIARYRAKGALRAVWPSVAGAWSTAQSLLGAGSMPNPTRCATFGDFWQRLEAGHPALVRHRIRISDAERELPELLTYLARAMPCGASQVGRIDSGLHAP